MKIALAATAALFCLAFDIHAADVTVLSAGAVKSALTVATQAWSKKQGIGVNATFASAGELRGKVAAGEMADILIVPSEGLAGYEKAGAVLPATRRDLGAVVIGLAVKQGAAMPDISTPEAFKRTLQQAKSLTYMDPTRGTSGKHVDESVLPRLGIRDEVRAKTKFGEGGFIADKVAKGEVELALHQMTEMLPVPGITIVGPLPKELQKETVYAAVIMNGAKNPTDAEALLAYLVSPEGRKVFLERGFSPP
ncbi:MAG: substrate-binding domain-containing protein [Usitatibacter sp.]